MLQEEWKRLDPEAEVVTIPTIEDAREYVGKISDEQGEVHTLVTGSFHLVGGFLSILEGEEFGLASTTKMEQSVEV
jgi:folylpolyglutamate synthase